LLDGAANTSWKTSTSIVKRSEGTRWSAKDEAVKAIAVSYTEVHAALERLLTTTLTNLMFVMKPGV